jgi:hypothetical protein
MGSSLVEENSSMLDLEIEIAEIKKNMLFENF